MTNQTTYPEMPEMIEVRMSDCPYGCKVYRCAGCGVEQIVHLSVYGCIEDGAV